MTDRWVHAAVSRKYTVVTLDRAGSELASLAKKVAQLPDTASGRAALVAQMKAVRAAIAAVDTAAARDDRVAAARMVPRLAAVTAQVDTLGDKLEAQEQREKQEQQK